MRKDPFLIWEEGMNADSNLDFALSASKFKLAAQVFFDLASAEIELARAYNEYSTLMDAYENIELGRTQISEDRFEASLDSFQKSSEILRSTTHFGYLAPFTSGCASAEVSNSMDKYDPDCLQGYKNSIALFEQSKIALSFQDETHPLMTLIEAYIRYCISQSLWVESLDLEKKEGDATLSSEKRYRSGIVKEEFEKLAALAEVGTERFCYLPLKDYLRVKEGSFLGSYPDASGLWLLNLGANPLELISLGDTSLNRKKLEPRRSTKVDSKEIRKGKIRVTYEDSVTGMRFEEGCLLVI